MDTVTTYTGNTPQTGDAYARVGAAGAGLTALGDTRIANLDAAVTSRMATYTQPTGFLAASFPSDPADQSLIIAAANSLATLIGDVPTNAELATALAGADDATLAAIAALSIPTADAIADEVASRTLSADIVKINGGDITGSGIEDSDEWRPA